MCHDHPVRLYPRQKLEISMEATPEYDEIQTEGSASQNHVDPWNRYVGNKHKPVKLVLNEYCGELHEYVKSVLLD